ncbi:MAG: metalloregulator ArsR/SmtB family transcription factor [Ardenticatenia bacterium]|nr:metalloregulator ArsR/SmtB family transcription factor [Ardenticatenia bacterium]
MEARISETQVETVAASQDDVCEVLYVDEPRVKAVAARMPDNATIQAVADIFKVLSDPTRVKIVLALSQAELCVCDLAALLGLSVSAVSHQLRLLRSLGLVKDRKQGRLAYYSLDDDHTAQLVHGVLEHVRPR